MSNDKREIREFTIISFDATKYASLADYFEQDIKPFIASLDYKEQPLVITVEKERYSFDSDKETLIKETAGKKQALGCGKIVVKSKFKKATKAKPEQIEISVELTPDYAMT